MVSLIGPRRISQVNQVAIPVTLMRLLGLRAGDAVFFEVVDDRQPYVRLMAARTAEERYQAGAARAATDSEESDSVGVRGGPAGHRTTRAVREPGRRVRRGGDSDAEQ